MSAVVIAISACQFVGSCSIDTLSRSLARGRDGDESLDLVGLRGVPDSQGNWELGTVKIRDSYEVGEFVFWMLAGNHV